MLTFPSLNELPDFSSSMGLTLKRERKEFLWDFIGHKQGEGLYFTVKSEWEAEDKSGTKEDLAHDFEKLLYVRAPLKLMICCTNSRAEIENSLNVWDFLLQVLASISIRKRSHSLLPDFQD